MGFDPFVLSKNALPYYGVPVVFSKIGAHYAVSESLVVREVLQYVSSAFSKHASNS